MTGTWYVSLLNNFSLYTQALLAHKIIEDKHK